jgi:hypothetical protein
MFIMGNGRVPFAIKNLLNEERCFGCGQPYGLAAAPPNTTASHLETPCIKSVQASLSKLLSASATRKSPPKRAYTFAPLMDFIPFTASRKTLISSRISRQRVCIITQLPDSLPNSLGGSLVRTIDYHYHLGRNIHLHLPNTFLRR